MDNIKRKELEKARKNFCEIQVRMAAVHMMRVFEVLVNETAGILICCFMWTCCWLRRYDGEYSEGL